MMTYDWTAVLQPRPSHIPLEANYKTDKELQATGVIYAEICCV